MAYSFVNDGGICRGDPIFALLKKYTTAQAIMNTDYDFSINLTSLSLGTGVIINKKDLDVTSV